MQRSQGAQHKRWREAEARAFLSGWRASGQPLTVYCQQRGVQYERVRRWRSKLGSDAGSAGTVPEFKPVRIVEDAQPSASIEEASMEIELEGGRRIRVRPGFDGEALVRLVVALERA